MEVLYQYDSRRSSENFRKSSRKERTKKWYFLDALQLAWFEMWIKYQAKRGRRKMISLFTARRLVIKILEEKKGFRVSGRGPLGTVIYW